jgi:hypothetical protein
MNDYQKMFKEQGYVLVKNFIPKDTAKYLYEYLKFSTHALILAGNQNAVQGDDQVPGSYTRGHGDLAMETLMKMMLPKMEECTGLKLFPTYTYSRIYRKGNELKVHKDRPSCEVSITLRLSANDDSYNWPIWMDKSEYVLEDGDGVIYRGCDLEHWRDVCDAPEGWRMGQVFMHYVDQNGPYPEYRYDRRYAKAKLFESDL